MNKNKIEQVTVETPKIVKPNNVKTSDDFSQSAMLDAIALNNELNSTNKGELRFKVVYVGAYVFDKTDKDNNPIFDNFGQPEQITSPYVEVTGEGISGKIGTKRLKKEELQLLEINQSYFGTYLLSTDDKKNFQIDFVSVVPFNQELQTRLKHITNASK